MAIVTLKLPDEVEQVYVKRAGGVGAGRKEMEQTLIKWSEVPINQRLLIFQPSERKELEAMVGGAPNPTPKELIDRLKRFNTINLGGVELPLTEVQLRRIVSQAKGQGRDPEAYLRDRMKEVIRIVCEG